MILHWFNEKKYVKLIGMYVLGVSADLPALGIKVTPIFFHTEGMYLLALAE